jgi:hypothetical protein
MFTKLCGLKTKEQIDKAIEPDIIIDVHHLNCK